MEGQARVLATEARRRVACALIAAFVASAFARHARAEEIAPREVPRSARTTPPVVSTAVRPGVLPEDPSSFATLVSLEDYAAEDKSVEDLLSDTVGVNVRRFGGPGRPAEISIRGSSASQVVILLDGVRLNSAQSGGVDLSTIPADLIERIEVLRGGGSVQVGSDAVGGVVNIITKRATGEPRTTLKGSGGSFTTWKGAATQTGQLGEAEFLLGADAFYTKGDWKFLEVEYETGRFVRETSGETFERINNETTNLSGLAKIGRDFGDRIYVSATDSLFYGSSGEPGPALFPGAFLGQSATAHRRRTRNVAKIEAKGAELTAWQLEGSLQVFHRYERIRFVDEKVLSRTPVDSDNRNHSLGGRFEVAREGEFFAARHRGSLGLELRGDWLVAKTFDDTDRLVFGLFLEDEISFAGGFLKLLPALRLDRTEGFGSEWLPRLGVVLELAPWLRIKGNVERSYPSAGARLQRRRRFRTRHGAARPPRRSAPRIRAVSERYPRVHRLSDLESPGDRDEHGRGPGEGHRARLALRHVRLGGGVGEHDAPRERDRRRPPLAGPAGVRGVAALRGGQRRAPRQARLRRSLCERLQHRCGRGEQNRLASRPGRERDAESPPSRFHRLAPSLRTDLAIREGGEPRGPIGPRQRGFPSTRPFLHLRRRGRVLRGRTATLAALSIALVAGKCGGGDGTGSGPLRVTKQDPRCTPLVAAFPGHFDFVRGLEGRVIVPEPVGEINSFDVDFAVPEVPASAPPFSIPTDSDGDGEAETLIFPVIDGVLGFDAEIAFVTASNYEEVIFFRPRTGQLRTFEVAVPEGYAKSPNSRLPEPGTTKLRTAVSTFACIVPEVGAVDSRGDLFADPTVWEAFRYCDPAPSFEAQFTSGAAVAAGSLFVSMSNLGKEKGRPNTQYLPGAVLVFDLDLSSDPPRIGPNADTPFILTTGFNPTHVTAYSVAGREFVLVTNSGALGIEADDPNTIPVEGNGIPLSDAFIDVIDAETLELVATYPLGLVSLSMDRLAIDPSGRIAMLGSSVARELYAIDLAPLSSSGFPATATGLVLDGSMGPNGVIFGVANPFPIRDLPDGANPATCAGLIAGTAFNDAGDLFFATERCDGTLASVAVDLSGSPAPPVASDRFALLDVSSLVSPLRSDTLTERRDLGSLRVRPGVPGVDFDGPEILYTVNQPGLLCALRIESN